MFRSQAKGQSIINVLPLLNLYFPLRHFAFAVSTPTRLLSLEEARMRANPSVAIGGAGGGRDDCIATSSRESQGISGPVITPGSVSMDLSTSISNEYHTVIAEHPGW